MGISFELAHVNYVAYLTDPIPDLPPHATYGDLSYFLAALHDDYRAVIAVSSRIERLIGPTRSALDRLHRLPPKLRSPDAQLPRRFVGHVLLPLRDFFSGRDLYGLVLSRTSLGRDYAQDEAQFFREAAGSSEHVMMLMPTSSDVSGARIVDPFPPLRALAETPLPMPAVVFWAHPDMADADDLTETAAACALSISEARHFHNEVLLPRLFHGRRAVSDAIKNKALENSAKTRSILHMSDLHFGDVTADTRRHYLKGHFDNFPRKIDCVVITGDLCNTPKHSLQAQYSEFCSDMVRLLNSDNVIAVPGNHDVRKRGIVGADYETVLSMGFRRVVVDDEVGCVFFCFNSVEKGHLARGQITDEQLIATAAAYEDIRAQRRRDGKLDPERLIKVCVLHHHPVAYETVPTTAYDKVVRLITRNEDTFTRLVNADRLLTWCADRGVNIVLHGHKHVAHHLRLEMMSSKGQIKVINIVGCGSTTGVESSPLSYVVLSIDKTNGTLGFSFYHDPSGTGAGFQAQSVSIDTQVQGRSW